MKRTRVAPVKGIRNARTSLAFLVPCIGLLRAVYLGPYGLPCCQEEFDFLLAA